MPIVYDGTYPGAEARVMGPGMPESWPGGGGPRNIGGRQGANRLAAQRMRERRAIAALFGSPGDEGLRGYVAALADVPPERVLDVKFDRATMTLSYRLAAEPNTIRLDVTKMVG